MVVIETKDALITEGMIAMTLGRDQPGGESKRENICRNQINQRPKTKQNTTI